MALKRVTDAQPLAILSCQCVGGCRDCHEAYGESLGETVSGADLGGSSKYSNENFED